MPTQDEINRILEATKPVKITINLDADTDEMIRQLAKIRNETISGIIRGLIRKEWESV